MRSPLKWKHKEKITKYNPKVNKARKQTIQNESKASRNAQDS